MCFRGARCFWVALADPGDEAGAQNRAVLILTAHAHAQMQNTCTDQQSLEGEKCSCTSFPSTPRRDQDLLDSGDISKHHIKCRDFELKLENSPRAVWMQLCPLFCTEARSQKHNLSPHSPFLSPMWQLPPSQLNISQSLQCPAGFHHPKSSQADSPCPSLSSILSCSSSQGVPSNNTKPASRMKNIWVLEFNPLCLPSPAHHRQAMDPFQHQACPPESLWAGVMLSMKKRDAFPARNTRQQVNLPELPKATRYK